MGMIRTRNLPAPTCWRCGRRIGYNQLSHYNKAVMSWEHRRCGNVAPPIGSGRKREDINGSEPDEVFFEAGQGDEVREAEW